MRLKPRLIALAAGAALLFGCASQKPLRDMEPGELVWMGGDTHLYLNHADLVEAQLARVPKGSATMRIMRRPESIFDYRIEDFEVPDYAPQGHLAAPVAV